MIMRTLSASEILDVWERGYNKPFYLQAILLLIAACPDEPVDALTSLSIGSRDARLLTLREWTFGPALKGKIQCPECLETVEFNTSVSDIKGTFQESRYDTFTTAIDGYKVEFRLPCTNDLEAIFDIRERERIRSILLRRCINSTFYGDEKVEVEKLPVTVTDNIIIQMSECDPLADMTFSLECPTCKHQWQSIFDIVSFFWSEIQAWAVRIIRDVHTLASAYGWSETDILSMSSIRRQMYLNMVKL
jgi:hypothetical protein